VSARVNIDPDVARARARVAANARWARVVDRTSATQAMRDGQREKWARAVDPDGVLPADLRERLVDNKAAEHMARMRLARARKSA
jgi:hypothetical protein